MYIIYEEHTYNVILERKDSPFFTGLYIHIQSDGYNCRLQNPSSSPRLDLLAQNVNEADEEPSELESVCMCAHKLIGYA
jgi:hypothetical protein